MTSNDVQITDQDIQDKLTGVLGFTSIDLATSKEGVNWCSTAFFTELDGDPFRLTLVLESGGRTLEGLRANPNVGVKVVPEGILHPFAQGLGTAVVRTGSGEREETFEALLRKEPQIEPFLSTPIEAVVVHIDWWRVTHVQGGWLPGRVLHRPGAS
ncbi:pyridoxamine 5'-phosphate oxidase family protein [Nocardia beijingensis]|uniref:pyridoxamine 5'-phosphate oxidase family protein n=1 Tax=Nocardia beijingensis TaxID=95162 RepID=UPI0018956750|nr:pyridoxamine 5'-phosphate oxidase family protein [Nocardia beijingensis]MBF6469797.1 pyridoxamine 5'-phosphate oxidase family protein [Nocardia beijingensis]